MTGYLLMTPSEFYALPKTAQRLLSLYARQYPQGFGKPCLIEVPAYRVREIEEAIRKEQEG